MAQITFAVLPMTKNRQQVNVFRGGGQYLWVGGTVLAGRRVIRVDCLPSFEYHFGQPSIGRLSGTGNGPRSDSPGYPTSFTSTFGWFGGGKYNQKHIPYHSQDLVRSHIGDQFARQWMQRPVRDNQIPRIVRRENLQGRKDGIGLGRVERDHFVDPGHLRRANPCQMRGIARHFGGLRSESFFNRLWRDNQIHFLVADGSFHAIAAGRGLLRRDVGCASASFPACIVTFQHDVAEE